LGQFDELWNGEVLLALFGAIDFHEFAYLCVDVHRLHCLGGAVS
jgi:hypothetical protein